MKEIDTDNWATVSRQYLEELEVKAKDHDYYRGYIDGMESALETVKEAIEGIKGN